MTPVEGEAGAMSWTAGKWCMGMVAARYLFGPITRALWERWERWERWKRARRSDGAT
jgi:hypothetical protein